RDPRLRQRLPAHPAGAGVASPDRQGVAHAPAAPAPERSGYSGGEGRRVRTDPPSASRPAAVAGGAGPDYTASVAEEGDFVVTLGCGNVYQLIPQVLESLRRTDRA
ncbi:hypothetical protein CTI14_55195, partial [Methylobacterium radiotolerans]